MRVADVDADRVGQFAYGYIQVQGVGFFGQRDRLPFQIDRTHIDGKIAVINGFGAKQSGPGFDQGVGVAGFRHHQGGDATGPVTAGLSLAAVGVEDAHKNFGVTVGGFDN